MAALLFGVLAGGTRVPFVPRRVAVSGPGPIPVPRRVSLLTAGPSQAATSAERDHKAARQGLFHHASRCLLVGVLAYRAVAVPVPLIVLVTTYGFGPLSDLLAWGAVLVLGNLATAVAVHRRPHVVLGHARALLMVDVAVAVGVNLYASASVPGGISAPYHDVFWCYLVGTVVLLTAAWGVVGGLVAMVASLPLQLLMAYVDEPGASLDAGSAVGRFLWLFAGLVMAVIVMAFAAFGARVAMLHGIRAGRASERARVLRDIHDGVLQTLEAMALATNFDRTAPTAALVELRVTARAQALRLRRTLDELAGERRPRLAAALSEIAAETVARGVRPQLVIADIDDSLLTRERSEAVRDAVREALVNTAKHAGVSTVVVRVARAMGGVEVVVRDHGGGFEVSDATLGFGIRESIVGRLTDVGGTAVVSSSPGSGTRVRLWVPL